MPTRKLIFGIGLGLAIVMLAPGAVAKQQRAETPAAGRPLYVTKAPIVLLKEMGSGAVLFSYGAEKPFAPASMAKVMTAYVVLDMIQKRQLARSKLLTVDKATWEKWSGGKGGSTMFLVPNEKISVDELLQGLVTVSANDAAVVLAVGIDGSEAAFVARMNKMATSIGMTGSHFGTANGWPDGGKTRVSADDLVRLADRLIREHPADYKRYFSMPSLTHGKTRDGKPITQPNRNPIIGRFAGADGLKTGHTAEAGYCFLGSAVRDGRRLIMVVAGMDSEAARRDEAIRLMEWGFSEWQSRPVAAPKAQVSDIGVQNGRAPKVALVTAEAVAITVPQGHNGRYHALVRYAGPIRAPVAKGDRLAELVITPDGLPPQTTPLTAADAVESGGWWDQARSGLYRLTGR